jgi:hypothetical protein
LKVALKIRASGFVYTAMQNDSLGFELAHATEARFLLADE